MGQGKVAENRGDLTVQQPGFEHSVAAAQGGNQAQHGRCRYPRYRGAEGQAEAFDGRGQACSDRLQFGSALQRHHRAPQGFDHAHKSAQQAQHHQQTNQVGRNSGGGQAHAFALNAQSHGVLQGGVQLCQPVLQHRAPRRRIVRYRAQRLRQGRRRLPVLQQFDKTNGVNAADNHGDGKRQGVGPDEARAHPDNGDSAQ